MNNLNKRKVYYWLSFHYTIETIKEYNNQIQLLLEQNKELKKQIMESTTEINQYKQQIEELTNQLKENESSILFWFVLIL